MAVTVERTYQRSIHPLHAAVLAGMVPLFLGVLLSDFAYFSSYEVQWKNFASWLIVGGLIFGGIALLCALFGLLYRYHRGRQRLVYILVLLAAFVLGIINALVHAQDAWESMPEALILSVIVALLAIAATGLGFSTLRAGEPK